MVRSSLDARMGYSPVRRCHASCTRRQGRLGSTAVLATAWWALRPVVEQREIWFAFTPGEPADPHQPRPVLVVSENVRNRLRDDVIVVPIFSGGRLGPTRVRLPAGAGGIQHDSVLFCEEITAIAVQFLDGGPMGRRVPDRLMREVISAILRALGEVVA
jgi:mRNA-degrading endonuclease toxin of MazEF toxin-antitoxin module